MLLKIAQANSSILADFQGLDDTKRDVLRYGMEVFLSLACFVVGALIIGGYNGRMGCVLLFFVGFMPLRCAVGGYHASSSETCLCLSLGMFAAALTTYPHFTVASLTVVTAISTLLVFVLTPICLQRSTRPSKQVHRLQKRSMWITAVHVFAVAALAFYSFSSASMVATSYAFAAFSLLVSAIQSDIA